MSAPVGIVVGESVPSLIQWRDHRNRHRHAVDDDLPGRLGRIELRLQPRELLATQHGFVAPLPVCRQDVPDGTWTMDTQADATGCRSLPITFPEISAAVTAWPPAGMNNAVASQIQRNTKRLVDSLCSGLFLDFSHLTGQGAFVAG